MVGGKDDCSPVIRVKGASFSDLAEVLKSQNRHGLSFQKGNLAIVCLLEHLLRVGNDAFWIQFDLFSKWTLDTFGWTVMPTLPPLPDGLSETHLMTILQFSKCMQARYLGNFLGTKDPKYSLWQPFFEINEKYGREKRTLSAPPVAIRNETFIECKGLVATSCGNFSQEIPPEILKDFLLGIFECLKSSYPSNIIFPDELSIERGLMRKGTKTAPVGGDPQGNTIFLCGASILRAVADPLSSITSQYGVNVINKCIGGDFFKKGVPTGFPTSEKPEDAIIFHFIGNNMFSMKTHFLQNNRFHMQNPNFLNDKDINLLISKLAKLLTDVKLDFGGKIFFTRTFS